MKYFIFLFSLFMVFPSYAGEISLSSTSNLIGVARGSELTYKVDYYGNKYDFIIKIKELGETISFDYRMTNSQNTAGSITISNSAIETAVKHMNNFGGGSENLTDQTTVFFSRQSFVDISSGKTLAISLGNNESMEVKMFKKDVLSENVDKENFNGKKIPGTSYTFKGATTPNKHLLLYDNETNRHIYTIVMHDKYPLITYMDLGWTIELTSISFLPAPAVPESNHSHE
jgi:hypothetical protein